MIQSRWFSATWPRHGDSKARPVTTEGRWFSTAPWVTCDSVGRFIKTQQCTPGLFSRRLGTCRGSTSCHPPYEQEEVVKRTIIVAAILALSSSLAFAQAGGGGAGGAGGGAAGAGNSAGGTSAGGSAAGSSSGTTSGTATGVGHVGSSGVGDSSDPSVRANPGLNANGPCNGARSTSGNNTPSC
jgi:hypothetical protein